MEIFFLILILVLNTLIYPISIFLILKNKNSPVFTIRSPLLLILNNIGGFLMTTTFILYHLIDKTNKYQNNIDTYCNILPKNYLIFHSLFYLSFLLRCSRLIKTCYIYQMKDEKLKELNKKYYRYLEIYYSKLLAALLIIIAIINAIINIWFKNYMITPYNFYDCIDSPEEYGKYISMVWIGISFIENISLITMCQLIIKSNKLTKLLKLELMLFTIIWLVYPNMLRVFEKELFLMDVSATVISLVCCLFLWSCLFLNVYLPLIYQYWCESEAIYELAPEQLYNFYLFLSNRKCVKAFMRYLIENESCFYGYDINVIRNNNGYNQFNNNRDKYIEKSNNIIQSIYSNDINNNDKNKTNNKEEISSNINYNHNNSQYPPLNRSTALLSLDLYTKIQTFRLYFTLEEDYFKVLAFAKKLCIDYFVQPDKELIKLLKSTKNFIDLNEQVSLVLNKSEVYLEHFDVVLVSCYNYLLSPYEKFKLTKEFEHLVKNFQANCNIQDALINVGLIVR